LAVEGVDLGADGGVFVGDDSVGDAGVGEGHVHRAVAEQGGDRFQAHAPVETGAARCWNPAEWVVAVGVVLHLVGFQRRVANRVRVMSAA
jgi:hypothetical protein